MINKGKYPLLGVKISAVDYEYAVCEIIDAALKQKSMTVSALAVHGVMTGYLNPIHRRRLNGIDLVVPDGQPVRWGLRLLHKISLPERVYGPELTLMVLEVAAAKKIPVYLYGSTRQTIEKLASNLENRFPGLIIAGKEPSKFRRLSNREKSEVVYRIKNSGARIVLVGLGCPRQEVWVYEYHKQLNMPLIAVGAAFDFHAGLLPQAPLWMQKKGLEWLFRLIQEPKRLWRRYLILNPYFIFALFFEWVGLLGVSVLLPDGNEPEESFG